MNSCNKYDEELRIKINSTPKAGDTVPVPPHESEMNSILVGYGVARLRVCFEFDLASSRLAS
jgi:hypothetical protein